MTCIMWSMFHKKYKESPLEAFAERLLLDVCKEIEQTYRRNIND